MPRRVLRTIFQICVILLMLTNPIKVYTSSLTQENYSLLEQISLERIMWNTQNLSAFGTRYVLTKGCSEAEEFLYNYFTSLGGYDVSRQTFLPSLQNKPPIVDYEGTNVIATKKADGGDGVVILCAHYDSISDDSFYDPYASAPGANDNAAGVAVLMEVAKIIGKAPLNRTLLFIAFSGEEVGLHGSEAWISENRGMLSSITGVICLDGIGRGNKQGIGILYNNEISEELADYLQGIADEMDYVRFHKNQYELGVLGTDSGSFDREDIRVVRLWDYDTEYIHSNLDTPDTLDAKSLREVASLILITVYRLTTEPLDEIFYRQDRETTDTQETTQDIMVVTLFMILVGISIMSIIILRRRRIIFSSGHTRIGRTRIGREDHPGQVAEWISRP